MLLSLIFRAVFPLVVTMQQLLVVDPISQPPAGTCTFRLRLLSLYLLSIDHAPTSLRNPLVLSYFFSDLSRQRDAHQRDKS